MLLLSELSVIFPSSLSADVNIWVLLFMTVLGSFTEFTELVGMRNYLLLSSSQFEKFEGANL